MADFHLDPEQVKKLEEIIKALPEKSENVINDILHTAGIEDAKAEIKNLLPVSKDKNGRERNKRHAKYSEPFDDIKFNLGFTVKSKGKTSVKSSFGYLFFPNEGHGKNNPIAQEFMEKGLSNVVPRIVSETERRLSEMIREEI